MIEMNRIVDSHSLLGVSKVFSLLSTQKSLRHEQRLQFKQSGSLKTKSKEQFGPNLVNFKNYFLDEKSFIRTRERIFISRFEFVECGNVVKY